MNFAKFVWFLFVSGAHSHSEDVEQYLKAISGNAWTVADDLNDELQDQENGEKTKPDYLYSNMDIIKLAGIEEDIYKAMKKYVSTVDRRLNLMKLYIKDYEQSSVSMLPASKSVRNYALIANPIITHRLIKRFADDFVEITGTFTAESENEEFLTAVTSANPTGLIYPTIKEDYENSMKSFLRIQQNNNLLPAKIAEGMLGSLKTGIGLNAKHAYDLGLHISETIHFNNNISDFASVIEWLEIAVKKSEGDIEIQKLDPLFKEKAEENLKTVMTQHDETCAKENWENDSCFTKPVLGKKRKQKRTKVWRKKQLQHRASCSTDPFSIRRIFSDVCSGNYLMPVSELSKLYCWYEHRKHPYFTIAPAKFELLHKDPPIYLIHEMIGPQRTKRVLRAASPLMNRSLLANSDKPSEEGVVGEVRTSSTATLYPNNTITVKDLPIMSRTIEFVSGLRVLPSTASEVLQVARYLPSHLFYEHLDSKTNRIGRDGRLATFMYYLNDVDVGGFTGFPVLGTFAKPVAGSGILWSNYNKNGSPNDLMYHGGCPVVHGIKWASTKWILINDNFDKVPCSLDPEE